MKAMMVQMQQMQQQMSGGGTDQLQEMQKTMYSMMQNQYMTASQGGSAAPATPGSGSASSYPGYGSDSAYSGSSSAYSGSSSAYSGYPSTPTSPYQYPSTIEYPKPPSNNRY